MLGRDQRKQESNFASLPPYIFDAPDEAQLHELGMNGNDPLGRLSLEALTSRCLFGDKQQRCLCLRLYLDIGHSEASQFRLTRAIKQREQWQPKRCGAAPSLGKLVLGEYRGGKEQPKVRALKRRTFRPIFFDTHLVERIGPRHLLGNDAIAVAPSSDCLHSSQLLIDR